MSKAWKLRLRYILSDWLAANCGWLAFNMVRAMTVAAMGSTDMAHLRAFLTMPDVIAGQIVFPLMVICLYGISGFYNRVFFKSRMDVVLNTVGIGFIATLVIYFAALINDNIEERVQEYQLILILWAMISVPVLAVRLIITVRTARRVRSGRERFNTLMVGTTRGAVKLAERLDNMSRSMGFNILGYVDPDSRRVTEGEFDRPVYKMSEIEDLCKRLDVKHLIVVPHRHGVGGTVSLLNELMSLDAAVHVPADLYQAVFAKQRIQNVVGEPLINITETSTAASTQNIKRISDVVISVAVLAAILPLLGAIAVAIKLTSKGPVIYRQERVGYHKIKFKILKFRSMYTNAEESGPALSSVNDPRITPIGRFLRKYRLDELPQFWNVLKGDMSLVGPRPEREYYVDRIIKRAPAYSLLHQVRPGITSWGMVKYGYASDVDQMVERMRYDLLYIDSVGLGVDLKILFYTVVTVVTGKGV